jgi:hypothetical protein
MPFISNYYQQYASNRSALVSLYHPAKSQLSVGDTTKADARGGLLNPPAVGQAAIAQLHLGVAPVPPETEGKAPKMPPGAHDIQTLDSLTLFDASTPAVNGISAALLILITGAIRLQGEQNPISFQQCFLVAQEGTATYLANDLFAFIYV